MSDISKINVGGTEYDIKDATARTETQPISRGGTGATTASGALSNLGAASSELISKSGSAVSVGNVENNSIDLCGEYVNLACESWCKLIFHWYPDLNASLHPSYTSGIDLGLPSYKYNAVYSVNFVSGSDRRLKENISANFTKLVNVFYKLRPVTFEYSDLKDGKTRIGFIAQEVETAMTEEGLNAEDFAFLKKDIIDSDSDTAKQIGDTTIYSLCYTEFIALNTYMIQQQQAEIDDLETRLSALEARLSNGDSN